MEDKHCHPLGIYKEYLLQALKLSLKKSVRAYWSYPIQEPLAQNPAQVWEPS